MRRVVIKIGSSALVDRANHPDESVIASLVEQMTAVRRADIEVVCVSSGAIAAGLSELGLAKRPNDLPGLQAAAAVGQARLVECYRRLFARHGVAAAQVLLTHADLRARRRHLNARNTLNRLLRDGIVPIVNENDTVAVDEIRVGDNDVLSALVAVLLRADLLVLLTDTDGLWSRPPHEASAELLREVDRITESTHEMARGAGSPVGTGGMRTKLEAAEIVTRCGERAVIANAREPGVIERLVLRGEAIGTSFAPRPGRLGGRKRWIAFFDHPRGALVLDDGAATAITERGASLLAVGIRSVDGDFSRGAPVRIVAPDGHEIARGLVNYPADAIRHACDARAHGFAEVLGRVVHRDNLVLTTRAIGDAG